MVRGVNSRHRGTRNARNRDSGNGESPLIPGALSRAHDAMWITLGGLARGRCQGRSGHCDELGVRRTRRGARWPWSTSRPQVHSGVSLANDRGKRDDAGIKPASEGQQQGAESRDQEAFAATARLRRLLTR